MKSIHKSFIILLLAFPLLNWATTVSEVEKHLMCTCGCTMALYTCECGTSGEMRAAIKAMIEQGQTKQQILDGYVARYGEEILSAPTKEGFNLIAWIIPFLAVLVIGVILFIALKRWSRAGALSPQPPPDSLEPKYQHRLEKELAKFEEGELR